MFKDVRTKRDPYALSVGALRLAMPFSGLLLLPDDLLRRDEKPEPPACQCRGSRPLLATPE